MTSITEATVEQAALDWLSVLGRGVEHGPDIALQHTRLQARRLWQGHVEMVLREALARLNTPRSPPPRWTTPTANIHVSIGTKE